MTGLRERKKAQTRASIQEHAWRLFLEHGFEETTVQEIADAAGVSQMTFFRHFPTKEAALADDDYDPVLMEAIAQRPAGEPVMETVRLAIAEGLKEIYARDRESLLMRTRLMLSTPSLQASLWQEQQETKARVVAALEERDGAPATFEIEVQAAAAFAALLTAVTAWARDGGELPELIDAALLAVS
jgi:AcrR family transcriptional regulator